MPAEIETVTRALQASPRTWLVTGVAGFIGSNLLEQLLKIDQAVVGADYILHQAALGSVPRSLEDPITTNANNVAGFLSQLLRGAVCRERGRGDSQG